MSESGMLAAVMTGLGELEVRSVLDPAPQEDQVVVEVRSVGICGSDAAYLSHGSLGTWVVETPFVLGHELGGVVVAVGSNADPALTGRRVAVEPSMPCYRCRQCREGHYHLCPNLRFLATPPVDGCLAERIAIDANCVFPVSDAMSFDEAALVEPASVGLWACRRARLTAGDRVHVVGAGPVGILSALAARALGAGRVSITDLSPERQAMARNKGLEVTSSPQDVDVLIECSGSERALQEALGHMAPAGRVALVGMSHQDLVGLPIPSLFTKELTFAMVGRYAHTWPAVINLVESGQLDLKGLVTHHFGLEESARAFHAQAHDPTAMKIMIHPTADQA